MGARHFHGRFIRGDRVVNLASQLRPRGRCLALVFRRLSKQLLCCVGCCFGCVRGRGLQPVRLFAKGCPLGCMSAVRAVGLW